MNNSVTADQTTSWNTTNILRQLTSLPSTISTYMPRISEDLGEKILYGTTLYLGLKRLMPAPVAAFVILLGLTIQLPGDQIVDERPVLSHLFEENATNPLPNIIEVDANSQYQA